MNTLIVILLAFMLVSGCTGITTVRYTLVPAPNECQVTEARPTRLSTLTTSVCWDALGHPIGLAGGGGKPMVSIPLEILGAAATLTAPIAGATILGGALIKASHATVDGSIRTTVKIPPVTVGAPTVGAPSLLVAPQ